MKTKSERSKRLVWAVTKLLATVQGCTNECCFRDMPESAMITAGICSCDSKARILVDGIRTILDETTRGGKR